MPAKRILIVSASAGAGHVRAAQAVEVAFREGSPDVEVKNIDFLDLANGLMRWSYRRAYNYLTTSAPGLWGRLYRLTDSDKKQNLLGRFGSFLERLNSRPLKELVKDYDPDAVIATHFLPCEALGPLRRKGALRATLNVVVTDFGIHSVWIAEKADTYFVAGEQTARELAARGVSDAKVFVSGIPIMPVFAKEFPPRGKMRRKLGIRVEPVTVLVASGGFGLMPADKAVEAILDAAPEAQVLAVAGRNRVLQAALESLSTRRPGQVVAYGFVNNMHELMAASDLTVAKSGGLTTSECLAMGLPIIVTNPIPGQEERNADFLIRSGAAVLAAGPSQIAAEVKRLLGAPAALDSMRRAASAVARPDSAATVAREVISGLPL